MKLGISMPSSSRGEVFLDEIRNELIEDGTKLFSEKGYKDTKVKDVTDEACISVGTFYNYFDSKEDLFFRCLYKKVQQSKDRSRLCLELLN